MSQSATDPLAGLSLEQIPNPEPPEGWVRVHMRSCALNHHDLWSLRGVGLEVSRLPMTLGCDGAGVLDDGTEVVIHAVLGNPEVADGDETLDPKRTLLSELHQGTLAEMVVVPQHNVILKPKSLSWEDAACMPSAWLTAYRMLTTRSALHGPSTVLVQGAGGGVATAAIQIASALGHTVYCTSRDEEKRARSLSLGAVLAVEPGQRLPTKVDLVIETVGAATWDHSLRSLRAGGRIVVSGATSGSSPPADLNRVFFLQLSVVGSTMGTRAEFVDMLKFVETTGLRPIIDQVRPLEEAAQAFERLHTGLGFGKQVLTVG
ncbi:MAG: zinc-binding dehydrogenase [Microthrixaceae bacterium]